MILKNKLTKESLNITYPEFRKIFAKEIQDAFENYRKTQLNKYSYNFKDDNSMEFNFYNKRTSEKLNLFMLFRVNALKWRSHYFDIQWNFNHFAISNWYIERMRYGKYT